jgi:hypothetical protein
MSDSDTAKLRALVSDIEKLAGGGDASNVCVDAVRFMDGNEDYASIGCNLDEHPGPGAFRSVIAAVRARPEVAAIVARIFEVMDADEGEWPYTDTLLVATTAHPSVVGEWFQELQPDEVSPANTSGLKGLPQVPKGHRWYSVWWD